MTDVIITKAGSYRTVDGRRVEIVGGGSIVSATNLEVMSSDGSGRYRGTSQKYWRTGEVVQPRDGEENDRIVGPWVEEITIGGKYRASTGVATVRCVADDHVFYVRQQDGTAGTLKVDDFFKHFTFVPPTKTVWVNLWWKNGAYVDTGATHATEEAARNVSNKPDEAVYIKTISLEVPA